MSVDLKDILKIAAGVMLGSLGYALVSSLFLALIPPSAQERAAQDLLDRQFAPAR